MPEAHEARRVAGQRNRVVGGRSLAGVHPQEDEPVGEDEGEPERAAQQRSHGGAAPAQEHGGEPVVLGRVVPRAPGEVERGEEGRHQRHVQRDHERREERQRGMDRDAAVELAILASSRRHAAASPRSAGGSRAAPAAASAHRPGARGSRSRRRRRPAGRSHRAARSRSADPEAVRRATAARGQGRERPGPCPILFDLPREFKPEGRGRRSIPGMTGAGASAPRERPSYWLTRFLVLRVLGLVYLAAFASFAWQALPLLGEARPAAGGVVAGAPPGERGRLAARRLPG